MPEAIASSGPSADHLVTPHRQRRLVLAALAAVATPRVALGGMLDWYNGVKLGSRLPAFDAEYLNQPPPEGARVGLIDFWATWCAPCRESIPHLNALHERFRAQGVSVLGLTQEKAELAKAFMARMPMHYAVGAGEKNALQAALGVKALPYAIAVDRSRTIIWRGQPDEIDERLVEQWLGQASSPHSPRT